MFFLNRRKRPVYAYSDNYDDEEGSEIYPPLKRTRQEQKNVRY